MKPADVKWNTYIYSRKKINEQVSKFRIGDNVRISKYISVFAQGYTPNLSEEVSWLKKLKILCLEYILLMILMKKNLLERFTEKNCKKQIKKCLELQK